MDRLLYLIEQNPRLSNKELAVTLGVSEDDVKEKIENYEESGIIKGYRAIIDKTALHDESVTALIEIKVQPKFGHGFNDVANRISKLEEVESVFLMSGGYDLCCIVSDKSFKEVAMFVSKRLSPIEDVVSTTTNFILKKYKDTGIVFEKELQDDRGIISL